MPKTTVTTTQEVTIAPKIAKMLTTELQGYADVVQQMKIYDEAKTGHSAEVLRLALNHVDGDKFKVDGFGVAVVRGAMDRRLNKDKLLKRLVAEGKYSLKAAMALLQDCTDEKPKKDHVRITVPGDKESDE